MSLYASATGDVRSKVAHLTQRQREIIRAILDGCTNSEMADRLGIREQTVKNHLTAIFQKTGASSRLELAIIALQTRLLEPPR